MIKSHLITTIIALLFFLFFCCVLKNKNHNIEVTQKQPSIIHNESKQEPSKNEPNEPKPIIDLSLKTNFLKPGSIIKFKEEAVVTNTMPETGKVVNKKLAYVVHIGQSELLMHIQPDAELEVIDASIGGAFPTHNAPHGMLLAGREDCIIKAKTKENKIIYILVIAGDDMNITTKNGYIQYSNPFSLRGTLHTPTFAELSPIIEIIKL